DGWWRSVKLEETESLIRKCLGLFIEARTNTYKVSPGQPVDVAVEIINRSSVETALADIAINGITVDSAEQVLTYNIGLTRNVRLTAPTQQSTPYWLRDKPGEGMYVVPDQRQRGLPADPPAMQLDVTVLVGGQPIDYTVPVIYKT